MANDPRPYTVQEAMSQDAEPKFGPKASRVAKSGRFLRQLGQQFFEIRALAQGGLWHGLWTVALG